MRWTAALVKGKAYDAIGMFVENQSRGTEPAFQSYEQILRFLQIMYADDPEVGYKDKAASTTDQQSGQ